MRISNLASRGLLIVILAAVALPTTSTLACPEIIVDPVTGQPVADPELQAALEAIEKMVDVATESEEPARHS